MRPAVLLILFLFVQNTVFCQRSTRKPQLSTSIYQPPVFEGRYFPVMLTNTDTIPFFLKLGFSKQIENGDTLNLSRNFPCSNPSVGDYYDLHDLVAQEDNCVRWYSLQQIKPKDTLLFVVKLKDFGNSDTARFYYCYTKEVKKVDRELHLYADPKKIYLMKDSHDFQTSYVVIYKESLNTGFTKIGLNIYITKSNKQ